MSLAAFTMIYICNLVSPADTRELLMVRGDLRGSWTCMTSARLLSICWDSLSSPICFTTPVFHVSSLIAISTLNFQSCSNYSKVRRTLGREPTASFCSLPLRYFPWDARWVDSPLLLNSPRILDATFLPWTFIDYY